MVFQVYPNEAGGNTFKIDSDHLLPSAPIPVYHKYYNYFKYPGNICKKTEGKVKLSLCTFKHHTVKVCGGVEMKPQASHIPNLAT